MKTVQQGRRLSLLLAGLFALAHGTALQAQEVTLRAVSAFDEKTFFARHFERFVEKVNAEGKGLVQINYIGGPKAMPPFEVGNAVRNKVVDMGNVTGAFYSNLVPEAIVMAFSPVPTAELRRSGALELMNQIMAPKGLIYQAKLSDDIPYHLYTNKGFAGSLKGQKIRITPVYREFFQTLEATVVQTSPGELYTALERGVVDGYGWPIAGLLDLGWQDRTKMRVDPGFYGAEHGILMNLASWRALTPAQHDFLKKQFEWAEAQNATYKDEVANEKKRQADAGIRVIQLSTSESKAYLATANAAARRRVLEVSPTHGDKLNALFLKD